MDASAARSHAARVASTGGAMVEKVEQDGFERLRARLRWCYRGKSPGAIAFQLAVIVIDLAIIAFFVVTPLLRENASFLWIDYSIAALLALDIGARTLASRNMLWWLRQPAVLVDLFILLTLLAPTWLANLGFLRILRLWSISKSDFLWRTLLRQRHGAWRDTVQSVVNLVTFLFLMTGFVYTFFLGKAQGIEGYLDALYFTVATVTTTGFGDITLPGPWGKLTSIVAMIVGISLFVRLAGAVVRPNKVHFPCPRCALQRHDYDAVHCKACGHILQIPDDDS